jgi:UPF0755 protein
MKKILLISGVIVVVVIAVIVLPKYQLHFNKVDMSTDEVIIFIPSGATLQDVRDTILANKIVDNEDIFYQYAEAFGYNEGNIEAGRYKIKNGQKLKHVIYGLKNGNQELKNSKIIFTYSQNIPSMVSKVCHSIEVDSARLVSYIMSEEVIKKYGFTEETIISMFLPDTYEVGEWDMDEKEFVAFMAKQYKTFWTAERLRKAEKLNMTQSEVSTLASIVMSEQSKLEQEWPIIAGLYINRLKQGIKLESDPTFKFCWGDELNGVQRLLYKHRDKDCPYNTYIYKGLPPGPIMLVSKKAIDAVLDYEPHNYIFMCAVGDGSSKHNFASTYLQHQRNAAIYRKNQFKQ